MNYLIYWNFHFYLFNAIFLISVYYIQSIIKQYPYIINTQIYKKEKRKKILKIRKLKKKLLLLSLFLFLLIN